jgi:quinol monooxygenase YgiN
MLNIIAKISPKPEFFGDALSAVERIVSRTRAEEGCHRFDLYTAPDQSAFYLIESWKDQAALDFHYAQEYVTRVFAAYKDWLAEPPRIETLEAVG